MIINIQNLVFHANIISIVTNKSYKRYHLNYQNVIMVTIHTFFVWTEHETFVCNQTSYKQMYIHLCRMKVILQMFAIILKRIEKVNLLCCFKMNPRKKVNVNFLSISSHCSIFEIRTTVSQDKLIYTLVKTRSKIRRIYIYI